MTLFLDNLILPNAMKEMGKQFRKFYSIYKKNPEEGIEFLKGLAIENPILHTPVGLLLFKMKAYVEAEMAFRKALANDRFDFVATYFLGQTLERMNKDISEAFSFYEMAFYIFPWDIDIKESYYKLKHSLKKSAASEEEVQVSAAQEKEEAEEVKSNIIEELFKKASFDESKIGEIFGNLDHPEEK